MKKFILLATVLASIFTQAENLVSRNNVVWESPSKDCHGSMPIGNGDIGLNVWMEKSGDLCFYIGKTDSWGDNARLLKVGKVRVKFSPSIITKGGKFKQTLNLINGEIVIVTQNGSSKNEIRIWVDANNPVVNIQTNSTSPIKATATMELWRTERYKLPSVEVSDIYMRHPDKTKVQYVEPDTIIESLQNKIGWYHHNKYSLGPKTTMEFQGMGEAPGFKDTILHRTFGAIITAKNAKKVNTKTLETSLNKKQQLSVYVLTEQPSTSKKWFKSINNLIAKVEKKSMNQHYTAHKIWWNNFWNRSYIDITEAKKGKPGKLSDTDILTRAYTIQRFIDTCGSRGQYPIKFNGSIFTVAANGKPGDADYRRWGGGFWWQNTRLPYLSMPMAGDVEQMRSLFRMYIEEILPVATFRTKKYFGHEGAFFSECYYQWGATFSYNYGFKKPFSERKDPLQTNQYHKWEWVAGPELCWMMLDYYDWTEDKEFLVDTILPTSNTIIKFFDQHYKTNEAGTLVMYPSQAAETWWDCTNPMPEVAALIGLIERLIALPQNLTTKKQVKYWKEFRAKIPKLPLRNTKDGKALAPAERFKNKRNCENPELYAVFPFRLIGVGRPNLEWGKNALKHRWDKGAIGWRQDDLFMAYLGDTKQAKRYLLVRAKKYDRNSRFPIFWGPGFDWVPDQDHGGILTKGVQSLLMQIDPYSNKIYLLPAWPKEWSCTFKLHAPKHTIVEATVTKGKITNLKMTPSSRRKDIIICNEKK